MTYGACVRQGAFAFAAIALQMSCSALSYAADTTPSSASVARENADIGNFNKKFQERVGRNRADASPEGVDILPLPRPEGTEAVSLELSSIQIKGMTAFSSDEIAHLWRGDVGGVVPLENLYKIADKITAFYHEHGYILSRAIVPEQEIGNGIATIELIEGGVGQVRVEGDFSDNYLVIKAGQSIARSRVFNIKAVEQALLTLNDLGGVTFRNILVPGQDNKVDLVIKGIKSKPIDVGMGFDNSGSKFLGPYSVSGNVTVYHLLGDFSSLTLDTKKSTNKDEMKKASLSYDTPIFYPSLHWNIDVSQTKGQPGGSLQEFEISSLSKRIVTGLNWMPIRERQQNLGFGLVLQMDETQTKVLETLTAKDKIRSVKLSANYDWTNSQGARTSINGAIAHGLEGFMGGSRTGDSSLSRQDARADFNKFEFGASRSEPIFRDMMVYAAFSGQFSPTPLYSSEEVGFGGSAVGRAYDPSQITGDKGGSLVAELRGKAYDVAPRLGVAMQPFLFADYGIVWNVDEGAGSPQEGASAGAGIRMSAFEYGEAQFAIAAPLIKREERSYPEKVGAPRLLIEIKAKY